MNLERYFDPRAGLLASCVDRWEPRPQQLRMAEAVAGCLEDGGACAVEAATGTGKTFAYLVPALLAPGRVVVATGTRNLQDQIFKKDLPLLRRVSGLDAPAVLVKGLSNYLCLRRYERVGLRSRDPALDVDPHHAALVEWAASTSTGDVSELAGVPEGYARSREVVSGPGTRIGASCPCYADCFVTRLRRQADRAKLIITNHHLFFADLALREVAEGVLPDYDTVIFDEAHRLDDVATEFFGHTVSLADISPAIREGLRVARGEYGADGAGRKRGTGGREPVLRASEECARRFFSALAARLAPLVMDRKSRGYTPPEEQPLVRAAVDEPWLDGPLTDLYHELDDLLDRAAVTVAATPGGGEVASMTGRRIMDLREKLALVLDRELPGTVFWCELDTADPQRTRIGGSPIDLAPLFRERVFERIGSVVLTSATLSPDRTMRHLARTIGYPADEARSMVLPTPFDVEALSLLYIPDDMPDPSDAGAAGRVAEEVERLVRITGGGALVLFSSWRAMKACYGSCTESLPGFELLLQGQAPRHELLGRLRDAGDAVLFATASFREGVDVPGPALRLVIVDKIPFGVPDEPVTEARLARIAEQGGDPFMDLQLPSATLSLKQGLGRLLRTRTDRGILAVLDPRIWRRRYGRRILAGLPPCPVTRTLSDVEEFWQSLGGCGSLADS